MTTTLTRWVEAIPQLLDFSCAPKNYSVCQSRFTSKSFTTTGAKPFAQTTYSTSKLVSLGTYFMKFSRQWIRSAYWFKTFLSSKIHSLGKSILRPNILKIYNSDETLRGHDDPSIEVFLSPSTLRPYLYWNSRCKGYNQCEESKSSCLGNHRHKEDDIQGKLENHFGRDALITSRKTFVEFLNFER